MTEYKDGAQFMLLGAPYPLRIADDENAPPVAFDEAIGFSMRADRARSSGFDTFLHWYTRRTEELVREMLPPWTKRLALRPKRASVRYAKTRWGSCTKRGDLMFNSRLAMLSRDVIEYVVVHELCHLVHMNHSQDFWGTVGEALPDYAVRRKKLRREERGAFF